MAGDEASCANPRQTNAAPPRPDGCTAVVLAAFPCLATAVAAVTSEGSPREAPRGRPKKKCRVPTRTSPHLQTGDFAAGVVPGGVGGGGGTRQLRRRRTQRWRRLARGLRRRPLSLSSARRATANCKKKKKKKVHTRRPSRLSGQLELGVGALVLVVVAAPGPACRGGAGGGLARHGRRGARALLPGPDLHCRSRRRHSSPLRVRTPSCPLDTADGDGAAAPEPGRSPRRRARRGRRPQTSSSLCVPPLGRPTRRATATRRQARGHAVATGPRCVAGAAQGSQRWSRLARVALHWRGHGGRELFFKFARGRTD